jgi:hypothetical protein
MTAIYITETEAVIKVHRHKFQVFRQHTLRLNVPVQRRNELPAVFGVAGTGIYCQLAGGCGVLPTGTRAIERIAGV